MIRLIRELDKKGYMIDRDYRIVETYDFPTIKCRALVIMTPESTGEYFTIFVHADLSDEAKEKAIRHELRHILNDDFYVEEDIHTIESNGHI